MKLLTFIIIAQASFLCKALQNSSIQIEQTEEYKSNHYNIHNEGKCTWTVKMHGNKSPALMQLTKSNTLLLNQVCQDLGCGHFYEFIEETSKTPNATCLMDCTYHKNSFKNCSKTVGSDCNISQVVCEYQLIRLQGGTDRCAGRVELLKDGQWGTVCDDQWDLGEANIVCAQLGCGYALSVSGQNGSFAPGRGPIHLDELNCNGTEKTLWECPSVGQEHDCGHKEDAGVVCSEMKAVRLTGGVDRCSGKVEIHRNGTWGTVCDNCWEKEEASMVCSMLNCGNETDKFNRFNPHLKHNNGSLWSYWCKKNHSNLWECMEMVNNENFCNDSKAAGVICKGSHGFTIPTTTTPKSTVMASLITSTTTDSSSRGYPFHLLLSPERIALVILVFLLFVAMTVAIDALFCRHRRRRDAHLYNDQVTLSARLGNCYGDGADLIKVPSNSVETHVPFRLPGSQLSGIDSTSLDSDYEQYDQSPELSVLSTFRNSQRYCQDKRNPSIRVIVPDSLEMSHRPISEETRVFINHNGYLPLDSTCVFRNPSSNQSVDTFESSSTSSGECYENTTPAEDSMTPGQVDVHQLAFPYSATDNNDHHGPTLTTDTHVPEHESTDDDELYSPVSPDNNFSSEDDYDDIGSY